MPDGILPFDTKLGLPQVQRVKIENVVYETRYRWNSKGGFATLRVTRIEDGLIALNEKIVELNPLEVRDPTTYEVLFTIMPRTITQDNTEVWVFWG